jgi:hypothetical protein
MQSTAFLLLFLHSTISSFYVHEYIGQAESHTWVILLDLWFRQISLNFEGKQILLWLAKYWPCLNPSRVAIEMRIKLPWKYNHLVQSITYSRPGSLVSCPLTWKWIQMVSPISEPSKKLMVKRYKLQTKLILRGKKKLD